MFLGSYVRKEALHSSQIEGTQATLEDILDTSNENSTNVDIEDVRLPPNSLVKIYGLTTSFLIFT